MMRTLTIILTAVIGIGILLLAGTILLPVIALAALIVLLAAFFMPRRVSGPAAPEPDELPEADIPASQAVIDVQARPVEDHQDQK